MYCKIKRSGLETSNQYHLLFLSVSLKFHLHCNFGWSNSVQFFSSLFMQSWTWVLNKGIIKLSTNGQASKYPSAHIRGRLIRRTLSSFFTIFLIRIQKLYLVYSIYSVLQQCLYKLGNTNLTYCSLMFCFYTLWKRLKTKGFLTFSGGIEMEDWAKMG